MTAGLLDVDGTLPGFITAIAELELDRSLTPGQRLARRVEAALDAEPDAGEAADRLRAALAEAGS